MRGRFWAARRLLALGFVFYFAVYGFRFAGVLLFLAAGVVLAFGVVDALRGRFPRFALGDAPRPDPRLSRPCAGRRNGGLGRSAGHGADDPEAQWVVVLGSQAGTGPSRVRPLRERLEAARDYLARYPEAVAVLSGAQGDGESITEATVHV